MSRPKATIPSYALGLVAAVAKAAGLEPEAIRNRSGYSRGTPADDARLVAIGMMKKRGATAGEIALVLGFSSRCSVNHRLAVVERGEVSPARAARMGKIETQAEAELGKFVPTPAQTLAGTKPPAPPWSARARDLRRKVWTIKGIAKQIGQMPHDVAAALGEVAA